MPVPFPAFAILALGLALQTPPGVPEAYRKQAQVKAAEAGRLVAKGEIQRAQEVAREAVQADPRSAEARYALGLALEAAGEFEQAEAEYRKMVLAPEPLLELSLARLYLRQGRIADAEQQARRAVEKNRWVPQPHLSLGAVAMRKKDYAAAIASFSEAVDLEPRDGNARLSLADAYRQAARFDEALTQYAQAQALKPDDPAAYVGRGQTWEQMGRPGEAIAAYEKALEVRPVLLAQLRLARLYLAVDDPKLRNPKRALELATAAAEATEFKNPEIVETLEQAKKAAAQ